MDSGNSSSLQSSSGGEEEYDSRPAQPSLSANFLNQFGPLSSNPQPSLLSHHHHHQHQPTLFDPSPNFFHAFSQSPSPPNPNPNSSLLNLDMVGSQGLRSDPNCTDLNSSTLPASAAPSSSQLVMGQGSGHQAPLPSVQLRSGNDNNGARNSDQTHGVTRNPKKRTRASRRAPTTVLTTDTSNFRAMVQEFTGIPAPPFSGSPYSRRLDLFGTGSGLRSGGHLEPMASLYPLRPAAQKVHQLSPFVSSPSSSTPSLLNSSLNVDPTSVPSTTNNNTASISATTSSFNSVSAVNYQIPSDLGGLTKHPQNMLNVQNQILSLHSLLQSPSLHPSLNLPAGLGAKSQPGLGLPSLDELGMSHGQVNNNNNANLSGLPSHHHATATGATTTTEGMRLMMRSGNSWGEEVGPTSNNVNDDGSQDHVRSFEGNNNYGNQQRVGSSCKLNYSAASSSEFHHHHHHHEKGLENVSSRGEGTVDSWICPSD